MTDQRNALEMLTRTVENCIQEATLSGLEETAALLRMVKLDLITRLHGITGEELDALQFVLESELRIYEHINQPELTATTVTKPRHGERGL